MLARPAKTFQGSEVLTITLGTDSNRANAKLLNVGSYSLMG
jgi:hypothetical protein